MAECSYSSCIQEKRAIKKELQKWTKDLVYLVGLERVAEELMGRRRWRQYQAHILGSDLEETVWEKPPQDAVPVPKDWQPEDRCYFCDGAVHTEPSRSPQPSESSRSTLGGDSPPRSQSSSTVPDAAAIAHPFPAGAALSLESLSQMASSLAAMAGMANPAAAAAAAAAIVSNPAAQPALNPLFNPGLFPWYLSQAFAKQQQEEQVVSPVVPAHSEQPLDLSAKSRHHSDVAVLDTSGIKVPNLDVKPIFRAKPRISTGAGRRTYTEEELQAALRDIQSGKLGTRRAAVIYGIPRSTLRNKVYKLERERERDHLLVQPSPAVVATATATTPSSLPEDASGDEDHRTLSMEELVRFSGLDNLPATDSLRQLLQSRSEKVNPTPPNYPHIEPGLAPYISQLFGGSEPSNLTELMKRMASSSNGTGAGTNGTEHRTSGDETSDDNVILRIPSFKPNGTESAEASESVGSGSNSPMSGKNIGVSLRDVITKSITQKFQQNPNPTPTISVVDPATLMANPLKRVAPSVPSSSSSLPPHAPSSQQKQSAEDKNKQKSGKGTRPKRGKYRNYDRDSLIEAVRAVQRGEMSVHRAGSYYGVPHSTLEYKVKERHLMRPRKRDMNKACEEKAPKLHSSAPMPARTPPKVTTFQAPQLPNLAAMASLANGLKVPSGLYPPYQFWPNANPFMISPELYQEQLLASQMMQRATGKSDVTDRFFDGLIRSTLDRQSSAVDGLSNRALLEQLCRGRSQQQTVVDLSQDEDKKEEAPQQIPEKASLRQVCDTEPAKETQDSKNDEGTSEEHKID